MLTTYHRDLGLPPFNPPTVGLMLTYSMHAAKRAAEKFITLPLILPAVEVVEVTLDNGVVVKWLVRVTGRVRGLDLCMVVQPDGFVRTVWLNATFDNHSTLDKSKYARVNTNV